MERLTILAMLFGLITSIYWMIVGWRAMQAHEKVADSLEWIARQSARTNNTNIHTEEDSSDNTE